MFRKGQNYRIFIGANCVAEETTCTVTRSVDAQNAVNKDLASDSTQNGLIGQNPVPMYKNMQFQVEAQGEGAISLHTSCRELMNADGGMIAWAPTDGLMNRAVESTPTYYYAICNDLVLNTPNRQPNTCTAQFIVIGVVPSESAPTPATPSGTPSTNILRGEFIRLFLGSSTAPVACCTNTTVHISLSMEDATTKDTDSQTGFGYKVQEPTMLNYDISTDCLYGGGVVDLVEGSTTAWELCRASGTGQQTKGTPIIGGTAIVTSIAANAPVGQNITYNASFTGIGLPTQMRSTSNNPNQGTTGEE